MPAFSGPPRSVRFQDPQFTELLAQLRRAGRTAPGCTLLAFHGQPRPQLQAAAEQVARSLGTRLHRAAGLTGPATQYIGETEKNLTRVLSSASATQSILFFDEADALFGKRTKVRDAHDRYANQEASSLVERLAKHRGVVIALFASSLEAERRRPGVQQITVRCPG